MSAKEKLIALVKQLGSKYEALALNESIIATRSGDANQLVRAQAILLKSDALQDMADKVVAEIELAWPKDAKG